MVADENLSWWKKWFGTLHQLNNIKVPRCLFPNEDHITRSEIHTFGDASEEESLRIRASCLPGRPHHHSPNSSCNQPRSKENFNSKTGTQCSSTRSVTYTVSREALTFRNLRRVFWTDSSTVMNWIRVTAAFYQTFVSNRIGEIQITKPEEWRFVPGKLNPADFATRSSLEEVIPTGWWTGFLSQSEDYWHQDLPRNSIKDEFALVLFTRIPFD